MNLLVPLMLAALGVLAGWFLIRLPRKQREILLACTLPLVLLKVLTHLRPLLFENSAFDILLRGQILIRTLTFLIPVLFFLSASCVSARRLKILLGIVGVLFLFVHGFSGIVGVLINAPTLRALQTTLDENGICRQSTGYTCGPAAAVTLLRCLGIAAEEGALSLASNCSVTSGTSESDMIRGIQHLYGIPASVTYSKDIATLKSPHGTLAMVKLTGWINHWVAVLDVSEDNIVTYGDPLGGLQRSPAAEFQQDWRHITIHLHPADRR